MPARCATCDHWTPLGENEGGDCSGLTPFASGEPAPADSAMTAFGLNTGPAFGCVLHTHLGNRTTPPVGSFAEVVERATTTLDGAPILTR